MGRVDEMEDEDAPEQVTLATGRQESERLRKEETVNKKRVYADAKLWRQQKSQRKSDADIAAKDVVQSDSGPTDAIGFVTARKEKHKSSERYNDMDVTEKDIHEAGNMDAQGELKGSSKSESSGLLDDSIVEYLAAQEKNSLEHTAEEGVKPYRPSVAAKRKRLHGKRDTGVSTGRVVVVLDESASASTLVENAVEFKRNRLFGEQRKRSLNMLPKSRSSAAVS